MRTALYCAYNCKIMIYDLKSRQSNAKGSGGFSPKEPPVKDSNIAR